MTKRKNAFKISFSAILLEFVADHLFRLFTCLDENKSLGYFLLNSLTTEVALLSSLERRVAEDKVAGSMPVLDIIRRCVLGKDT